MTTMTPERIAAAVRRSAITLGADPAARPYTPETIATVHKAICLAMAGAGSKRVAAERLANDPTLAGIPDAVVTALTTPSLTHFARALADDFEPTR